MISSGRSNPPKPLQSTSGRYLSVHDLVFRSPLPSPSLPSIVPRHGKKPARSSTRRVFRTTFWFVMAISMYHFISFARRTVTKDDSSNAKRFSGPIQATTVYEIVGGNELPEYAAPVTVTDADGGHRWTISIPSSLEFPLLASDYADVCANADRIAQNAAGHQTESWSQPKDYDHGDPRYIDVGRAQSMSFLPQPLLVNAAFNPLPVCKKSLTYVLDAAEAGLGSQLLGLWLSFGLAKREHRAFFIEDRYFAYGKFSSFFSPLPPPSCRRPEKTQLVPCPPQANHLVVGATTHQWIFGSIFQHRFLQREIFDMARIGYKALFQIGIDDKTYVDERYRNLKETDDRTQNPLIGIHLRRGDRHPFEYIHQHGYIPPYRYADAAQYIATQHGNSTIILTSDDPDMYDHVALRATTRAQNHIILASKKSLTHGGLGWEGGFFKDAFWGLGLPLGAQDEKRIWSPLPTRQQIESRKKVADKTDVKRDYRRSPTDEALQLRELIGRAYLVDLAVLSKCDWVVCAVSSFTCRILAVMLGWEHAFDKGHWKNIDGSYGWMSFSG